MSAEIGSLRSGRGERRPLWASIGAAAALNLPFIVCHPAGTLVDLPLLRSLAVGLVLFLLPGVAWVGAITARRRAVCPRPLWVVCASTAVLLLVLTIVRLVGIPLCGGLVFNGVWLLTNVGVALNFARGGSPTWGIEMRDRSTQLAIALFLAAFGMFFHSATRVVPPMEDHDFDVLGCGYSLVTRGEPLLVSDHRTVYQFSHPPLAYLYTAGSFLYFGQLDYLAYYDRASRRALAARRGDAFDPFDGTVGGLSNGTGDHRVVGRAATDYIVDPPLADGTRRIPVWLLENGVLGQYYERDPRKLAARTANVFLAALTVAMLGGWIGRMTGSRTMAILVSLAYATSPEVFVRAGYGGHFASSNFAVAAALIALERRERRQWISCLLAGGLLALFNHKLIVLPAAVVVWQLIGTGRLTGTGKLIGMGKTSISKRLSRSLLHPIVLGFAGGTALFWLWGLSIDPAEFFHDHLKTHFVDRLTHHNPAGYGGYPSVPRLWLEFCRHTGYLLLPLGIVTLVLGCVKSKGGQEPLLATYALLLVVAFSIVDWRQTKHLMPLLLVLYLAPAAWAVGRRGRLLTVGIAVALLLLWNLRTIAALAADFRSLPATPMW